MADEPRDHARTDQICVGQLVGVGQRLDDVLTQIMHVPQLDELAESLEQLVQLLSIDRPALAALRFLGARVHHAQIRVELGQPALDGRLERPVPPAHAHGGHRCPDDTAELAQRRGDIVQMPKYGDERGEQEQDDDHRERWQKACDALGVDQLYWEGLGDRAPRSYPILEDRISVVPQELQLVRADHPRPEALMRIVQAWMRRVRQAHTRR
mmetsp:Transcript_81878/g.250214  ORF Transcript_81878/g.250214 Transcript_81878/m.250214 type:complete len:211 (-) Transcript_81878:1898-2530(-)